MAIRNRHRVGQHLVVDEESGFIHYSDEVTTRWDRVVVAAKNTEPKHPSLYIRVRKEGVVKGPIVPEPLVAFTTVEQQPFVGMSAVTTPIGPASHLFGWTGSFPQGIGYSIISDPNPAYVFEVT